jgi:glycosyltransferase involved in cell wall biosynthesis
VDTTPLARLAVLHVVVPTEVGGMQRVVEALAKGFHRRGHRVGVAGVLPGHGPAQAGTLAAVAAAGAFVTRIRVPGRGYLSERAAIADLCRAFRPDVVHTHGYRPDVVDAGVARRAGIPAVTTVHGFTGGGWKDRLYERLQLHAFRRFDAVVAVSRPLAGVLARAGVPRERIHVVPNAWAGGLEPTGRDEARRALGVPAAGVLLGWVGRFTREKGADVLVRALPLLDDLPLAAALVGGGPQRVELKAAAAAMGLAARTHWPGVVPDAGRLMAAFDVFVLSSRTEGTPIVLFEAMAAGVPIVATRVGGVPDVIGPDDAALVPADDPPAIAAAIRGVLAEPARARDRVDSARRRLAAEFALEPWLDRYEGLYRSLRPAGPDAPAAPA